MATPLVPLKIEIAYLKLPTAADPGFWNGGGHKSSAEGASIEAPQAPSIEARRRGGWGLGRHPPMGVGSGEGAVPPPQKIF